MLLDTEHHPHPPRSTAKHCQEMPSQNTPTVQHDPDGQRFVVSLEESNDAYLDYERKKEGPHTILDFKATFVPPKWRNEGLATEIVTQAFRYAEEKGYRVKPTCPFVDALMKRKQEFEHLRV